MYHARIFVEDHERKIASMAEDAVAEVMLEKPDCVLGLATGSSPIPMYRELIARSQCGKLNFSKIRTVNLDEYKGLGPEHPQSYRRFMQEYFFDHIPISPENTIIPDGLTANALQMCREYDLKIEQWGGIDLQVLGLGHDGHIGFNEPAEQFVVETHEVTLNPMTIVANQRFFSSVDEVPREAYTMGIGSIMSARKILMIVSGKDKAEILKKALFGPVTPKIPASILQFHPDVTVVCDASAKENIFT